MTPRVIFACSGDADDLAAIPQLAERFNADVVALTLDLGQAGALDAIRQAALAAGAVRAHVLDARDEFARYCIAVSFSDAPVAPRHAHNVVCMLIARKLVEIARIEAAGLVAHGGSDEDHAEIDAAVRALEPSIRVVRTGTRRTHPHTVHATLWERPTVHPSTSMPQPEPDAPARLEIAFEAGVPVSINGIAMSLPELIESVSTIAGTHGVGRVLDTAGAAVHAPAAVVLQAAHDALGAEAVRAADAMVCLELFKGQHRILSAHHS